MIRYTTPYSTDGDLAAAYNDEMERARSGEYVCFLDRDAYFTYHHFGHQIERIVKLYGTAFYSAVTNRTNCGWQRINAMGNDRYHAEVGKMRYDKYQTDIVDHTDSQLWSGHCMVIPKDGWIPLEGSGILGIDNQIHMMARRQGLKVYLMPGVYVWHYYSAFDGESGNQKRDKSHLYDIPRIGK